MKYIMPFLAIIAPAFSQIASGLAVDVPITEK